MRTDEQASYYDSVFADLAAGFIRYKRAQGLAYTAEPRTLRSFSRFLTATGVSELRLSQDTVDEWCRKRPPEKPSNQRTRIAHIRQFLEHLRASGLDVASPQPTRRRRPADEFTPHVFTTAEITAFFAAADGLTARKHSVMPEVLPVLFRLLYGCGLRVSEVLNLTRSDVDLDNDCVTIRHAKLDQDRIVPLSSSMAGIMRGYDATATRLFVADRDTLFFSHRDGRPIAPDTIYRWFRKVLWAARISHGGRGHGPRVHDLRHTFAVYSLHTMVTHGADVYWALPTLSTYLGHSSVAGTGTYVRLTQSMFPEVSDALNAIAAEVIPGGEEA
ncbi:MAG: tyrosine-type recombinase/integrase [Actinomycetes bacterium]